MKRVTVSLSALLALLILTIARPVAAPRGAGSAVFNLVEATVAEMHKAFQTGLLTSEQLVEMYLARIAAYDGLVNAYIQLDQDALHEARTLDAARREGKIRRPLEGIPVALKDIIDTADMPTTGGSVTLEGSFPPDDAFLTAKLRAAGAIIVGKLTLTEFANFIAIGMPSGYSSLGQFGYNPYDPRRQDDDEPVLSPGGSSSGSGIAATANLAALTVGTETSGSILSPASSNGVVGIKPTVGLISRDGIIPITADQDTAGPITRTVTDAAIMLGVMAGFDPADPATAACLIPGNCLSDYTPYLDKKALKGARIAVVPFPDSRADVMNNAINVLRALGAYVEQIPAFAQQLGTCVSLPAPATCSTVLLYGQKRDMNAYLATRGDAQVGQLSDIVALNQVIPGALRYGQEIFEAAAMIDTSPGSSDTLRYLADRAEDLVRSRGALDAVYHGLDGVAGTADDFDAVLYADNLQAGITAKAGYPSITVPGGFRPSGGDVNPRPVGVTFTGPAFSEARLIAFAFAFEQATHYRVPPASTPPLPTDIVTRP